jgi:mannose-1-phosphate guanylyltransferase
VRLAFEIVEKCPSQIVFLGVKPDDSEPEYGYLIPENGSADKDLSIQNISIFLEKPERSIAEQLIVQGALWNTMVMVFKPEILLHLVKLSAPKLYQAFQIIFRALGDPDEDLVIREVYKDIEATNLSKDLLAGVEAYSRRQLSVLPMNGVFWSDWGTEERIISVLRKFNYWNGLQKNCELSDVKHPEMAPPLYLLQDAHA